MNKISIDNFQPGLLMNSEQKADKTHVSPAIGNTNVVCRLICFFAGHKKIKNKCQRCGTQFGVPKMDYPPEPP